MFELLREVFPPSPIQGPTDLGIPADGLRSQVGVLAGTTFGDGLYRLHTAASAAAADQLVRAAYPECEGRIACFGVDWLGRQFSLDPSRGTESDPEVLLFEVGTGESLEIPVPFSRLHDEELVEYPDAALAAEFFAAWRQLHPQALAFDQCVGYRVPLFLGGVDDLENLEVTDMDVYWSLTGQLKAGLLG